MQSIKPNLVLLQDKMNPVEAMMLLNELHRRNWCDTEFFLARHAGVGFSLYFKKNKHNEGKIKSFTDFITNFYSALNKE